MSLLSKTARLMHHDHGFYVTNGFTNAECGSWGECDGDIFERLGGLAAFNKGIPDPKIKSTPRTTRWFSDKGISIGKWQVGAAVPGGMAKLSISLSFESQYAVAMFLADYDEQTLTNNVAIGDALAELYREKGKDWRLANRWVYTALKVGSGFIVMSQQKNTTVTLSGSGVVSAAGVPIKIDVAGFQSSKTSALEFVGLDGVAPLVQLMAVKDGAFSKAHAEQVG